MCTGALLNLVDVVRKMTTKASGALVSYNIDDDQESEYEIVAGKPLNKKQNDYETAAADDKRRMSKNVELTSMVDALTDSLKISSDQRRESGADADEQEIGLVEERLARGRIKELHDVFVSSRGSEGLGMDDFRSAMRQVLFKESGRVPEDDELDKVSLYCYIGLIAIR